MIYKIFNGLMKPYFSFNIKLPLWLLILIFTIPFQAYGDLIYMNNHNYLEYLTLCLVEIFLIYLGYAIANYEFYIRDKINKGEK